MRLALYFYKWCGKLLVTNNEITMKKIITALLTTLTLGVAQAEYIMKLPLQADQGGTLPQGSINIAPMSQPEEWLPISPAYTLWTNAGQTYDCTNWTPDPSTITVGQTFTQTANDCKQDQTRSRQDREQETTTLAVRDTGLPVTENQTITTIATRDTVGTLETWIAITPTYTAWVNSGAVYECTNWTPDPSTIAIGQPFTQTATDCKQDQTRSRQNREQETTTLDIRNVGTATEESQTIQTSLTKTEIGTKITKTCRYNAISDNAYNLGGGSADYFYTWDGAFIGYASGANPLILGGYKYTYSVFREKIVSQYFWANYYEICREPI
ncbi:hypothetical protein GHO40_19155 [Pseudomonas helleri]|uniref:Uncharacterized protein n=1 Tax=Pseudomonas helleri TaxID=1608996 RepID=A0A7X1XJ45_9PSED|nr:hypothetical protein [Pseudomonas helleri]MQT48826.1 hypothetical protein [Pseudomonas helleri]MQT92535.1 hypothetical protein [Pseudomonas helleri]